MDKNTGKYWTKAWSLVEGCTPCSPGCLHCWSKALAERFGRWPEHINVRDDRLHMPTNTRKPTVFSIWNDLYHEDVGWNFIYSAMRIMSYNPKHTFLVLTKRADRMSKIAQDIMFHLNRNGHAPLNNVWHGVTVCNQPEANAKIPELLKVPGHKWLSIEPMLGEVDLRPWLFDIVCTSCRWYGNDDQLDYPAPESGGACPKCGSDSLMDATQEDDKVEWVVVGAETGPKRRPCNIEWIRSIVQQCQAAGVPVWVKAIPIGKACDHCDTFNCAPCERWKKQKVSHNMSEWPEDLRIRQVPWVKESL